MVAKSNNTDNLFYALDNTIAAMPLYVYWLDENLVYQGCSELQAKTFGFSSRKEIVGKKNKDLKNIPSEILLVWDKNNQQVVTSGLPIIAEEPFILANGIRATVLVHKIPIKEEQKIIGLLGISYDISEKNLKAERFKKERDDYFYVLDNIIANLPGHVYWQDRNNIFLGCNELQARSAGLKSRFDIIGKSNYDMPWKLQADAYNKINMEVMMTGKEYTIEEYCELFDGRKTVFLSKKVPMRNNSGEIIGILGISFDITERKQIEEKLLQTIEMAESANKAKSEFLQNMRHDFRTPFSGIIGVTQILYESETDDTKKVQLNSIIAASQTLLKQLNEITDFIAIEDKEIAVLNKQFDLYGMIKDLEHILLPAIQEKSLMFTVQRAPNVPRYVIGDRTRVERILMNLIANAIKFTEQGEITVKIDIASKAENSNNLIIKFVVEDTGIGMTEYEQSIIFEKFSRGTLAHRGIYPGKGLGLKIVKQFLEDVDGEIHLKSAINRGTTFVILIPFKFPLLNCDEKELFL